MPGNDVRDEHRSARAEPRSGRSVLPSGDYSRAQTVRPITDSNAQVSGVHGGEQCSSCLSGALGGAVGVLVEKRR